MVAHRRRTVRCLVGIGLIVVGTAGCASGRKRLQRAAASHLADTGTSYNLAIEQAQDEMLLLNVIRAKDHRPMYVTDASKVTGTVKLDLSLGLKIPWRGGTAKSDYTGSPNIDYSSSPAMDVNLLDAQDFMNGFLAPIPQQLFAYYWDQGWTAEFLLYLLVLRVDVYKTSTPKVAVPDYTKDVDSYSREWSLQCSVSNHPNVLDKDLKQLADFAQLVYDQVVSGRPRLHSNNGKDAAVGPPLPLVKFADVLAVAQTDKLSLSGPCSLGPDPSCDPDSNTKTVYYRLKQPKTVYTLAPVARNDYICNETISRAKLVSWHDLTERAPDQIMMRSSGSPYAYALKLRSPEGLLYYLGQLARLEARNAEEPVSGAAPAGAPSRKAVMVHACDFKQGCDGDPRLPLFVALETRRDCSDGIIEVRSQDNKDYVIPTAEAPEGSQAIVPYMIRQLAVMDAGKLCFAGRSMMALDLAAELIGLQKTASDFTTTTTVKLVGQ